MNWVLTIPKTEDWNVYEKEMELTKDYGHTMAYRLPYKSKAEVGDRCYVVYDGRVRGWMEIVGKMSTQTGFRCTTTKRDWPPGHYILRSGPFHRIRKKIEMKGFQGLRRYKV